MTAQCPLQANQSRLRPLLEFDRALICVPPYQPYLSTPLSGGTDEKDCDFLEN
jgi:hypothetical protein